MEWNTKSENIIHAITTGLKIMPSGKKHYMYGRYGKDNPYSKPVSQYDLKGNFIKMWENGCEAAKILNIHEPNICKCCRGERKTTGGYIWRYKEAD